MYPSYFLNLHGTFSKSYDTEKENNHPMFPCMTIHGPLLQDIYSPSLFPFPTLPPPISLHVCLLTHITKVLNPSLEEFIFLSL